MKKFVATLALILLVVPATLASASVTLNVYNWGDYIDMDTLDQFTARTGIRINYEMYETNEDMYTKLKRSATSYDLVFPSDYMIERMIREEMLLPIELSAMPNAMQHTDPRFLNQVYDPQQAYSVPYTWGTVGILYNTNMVPEPPTSWDALWDENYAYDILMLNSARDSIGIALKRLGYSMNSVDPDELEAAKQSLIEQSPLVLAYVVDEVKDKMIAGEAALALVWSGDAQYCMDENPDLDYVVPLEGSNLFFDAMCVPASSRNPVEAQMLIDFLCEPEIAMQNYEYVGYAIPNTGAIELMGEDYTDSMVSNPPQDVLER
ncbi:MAG: ABC transporter substrate-binding protein, partial [Clostridia bacterium]|nr:ABC transporter substrate-binding protein [Clostridia bacterium]